MRLVPKRLWMLDTTLSENVIVRIVVLQVIMAYTTLFFMRKWLLYF